METRSKKLSSEERQQQISQFLLKNDKITVKSIADMFSVTTETARSDLDKLEEQGLVKRFHGGALRQNYYHFGQIIQDRMSSNVDSKRKIARMAASYITDGSTIFLDSGSTNYYIAEAIADFDDILVITNGLSIATYLGTRGVQTMIVGGEIHRSDMSAVGIWAERCMSDIMADISLIGASGLDSNLGPSVENMYESSVKNVILSHSKVSYVVADSSKTDTCCLVRIAPWQSFQGLIIDDNVSSDYVRRIEDKTEVIIAK